MVHHPADNLQADVVRHITALGYGNDDRIFYSGFYPKTDERAQSDKGRKANAILPTVPTDLNRWESDGRGVYLVVNGAYKKADVASGRALFFEYDQANESQLAILKEKFPDAEFPFSHKDIRGNDYYSVPTDVQSLAWVAFDLPEPTFQVNTGGKSIHSYWVLDTPCPPQAWRSLQTDLLDYSAADRSLKNENRVMRLAGMKHAETGEVAQFIPGSDQRYSFEHLRSVIPSSSPQASIPMQQQQARSTDWPTLSYPEKIDLTKELLNYVPKRQPGTGTYDDALSIVAALSHEFDPNTALSLCRYWSPDEDWGENLDRKIASFKGTTKPVTIKSLFKAALDGGWKAPRVESQSSRVENRLDSSNVDRASVTESLSQRRENLDTDESETESIITEKEWERAARMQTPPHSFDPFRIMPKSIADAATHDAYLGCIDPLLIWSYLLSISASLMGGDTVLDVGEFQVPSILWTMNIASSGARKSYAEKVTAGVLKNFEALQQEANEAKMKDYQERLKNTPKEEEPPDAPYLKEYLLHIGSPQAAVKSVANAAKDNDGIVWIRDEVQGLFASLKQWTKGDNESESMLLEMYDGNPLKVSRVSRDDSFSCPSSRLSIVGGIQPEIFKQTFDMKDPKGLLGRFLPVQVERLPFERRKGTPRLPGILGPLYKFIEGQPWGTLRLSEDADDKWSVIANHLNNAIAPVPNAQPWANKLASQVLKLAMVIHAIECYYSRDKDRHTVTLDTLDRAYWLGLQYQQHVYKILDASDQDDLATLIHMIQDQACEDCDAGVNARDIVRTAGIAAMLSRKAKADGKGQSPTEYCKSIFEEMEERGMGYLSRNKARNGHTVIKYHAFPAQCEKSQETIAALETLDTVTRIDETHTGQEVECVESTLDTARHGLDTDEDSPPHVPQGNDIGQGEPQGECPFNEGDFVEFTYSGCDKGDIQTAVNGGQAPKGTQGFVNRTEWKLNLINQQGYWLTWVIESNGMTEYPSLAKDISLVVEVQS